MSGSTRLGFKVIIALVITTIVFVSIFVLILPDTFNTIVFGSIVIMLLIGLAGAVWFTFKIEDKRAFSLEGLRKKTFLPEEVNIHNIYGDRKITVTERIARGDGLNYFKVIELQGKYEYQHTVCLPSYVSDTGLARFSGSVSKFVEMVSLGDGTFLLTRRAWTTRHTQYDYKEERSDLF